MNANNNKSGFRIFLWTVLGVVAGFYLGRFYILNNMQYLGNNKIDTILNIIDQNYVDTVNMEQLIDNTTHNIIKELDPHSVLIPAGEIDLVTDKLEGSFSGIGVSFNMLSDTILILTVIHKGPAEKAGILPYDRIISINDSVVAGKGINDQEIIRTLRGAKNSKVKLGIKRSGEDDLLYFDVTRGDVPDYSIEVAYKVSDGIGYMLIDDFGRTTYNEFITAIAKLRKEGCEKFIIDLRGNTGGYMDAAIHMLNEFIPSGQSILYYEGKAFKRQEFRANGSGSCQNAPVVVLVDEASASASEIFAGAIQDNDRGLIIGRRTFGKGLVQSPIKLKDGSELRLTIARYYTPSGRCIQKQYELGNTDDYNLDLENRYLHGEFDYADSIKVADTLAYKTLHGRTVYGGGGIMPDIFIPRDTSNITSYYVAAYRSGAIYRYVLEYSDRHHAKLASFKTYQDLYAYLKTQPLLNEFTDFAETQGMKKRPTLIQISGPLIEKYISALIVRNFFNNEGYYPIILTDDVAFLRALKEISNNDGRPVIP